MEQFLMELVAKYPVAASVVMAMGIFRVAFKPLMSILRTIVASTPSAKDDAALAKAEASSVYKALVWACDYLLSIKLPGAK